MTSTDFKRTLEMLSSTRNIKSARRVIWKSFLGRRCTKAKGRNIRIALLNAPCHGFGDIIFAQKLVKYLKKWYGCTVHVFTTLPKLHIQLGEVSKNLIKPVGTKRIQCRSFHGLKFGKQADRPYDLYFVAPLTANYSPKKADVIRNFTFANKTNIFFFSEYNTAVRDYQFPTGLGRFRLGLLLVKPPAMRKPAKLKNPYCLIYIASEENNIPRANSCYLGFMEMISAKYYKKKKKLDVVVPSWIVENLKGPKGKQLIKKVRNYYPEIRLKDKKGLITLRTSRRRSPTAPEGPRKNKRVLTIRGDILPVQNKKMFSLMRYSLKDILLTGDQSITDALSCCSSKNIFYQIAPWKEGFGRELAKLLPNRYLYSKKTSCGTLKALRYKSSYRKFIKKWDFRTLARPKMDAVMLGAAAVKKNESFDELSEILSSSRTARAVKRKASQL